MADLFGKIFGTTSVYNDYKTGKTTTTSTPGIIQNLASKIFPQPLISPVSGKNFSQNLTQQLPKSTLLPSPTPSPSPKIVPSPTTSGGMLKSIDDFVKIAMPIFHEYGIPPAVGFGQFAAEGRLKGMGAARNNFYNIQAFDSNPNAASHFPTPEEGVRAYAKLISGQYELGQKGSGKFDTRYKDAYALRSDPRKMIQAIQKAGYASRPDYAAFVMSTPEFQKYIQ